MYSPKIETMPAVGFRVTAAFAFLFSLTFLLSQTHAQDTRGSGALDESTFDKSVRPQDDLYQFVNGTWLRNTPIPDDKSNYGSFTQLADLSQERSKTMIEELSKEQHPDGSDAQKVGAFYKSFMDVDRVNELGIQPLQQELDKIDVIENRQDLTMHMAYLMTIGVDSPFGFYVSQDAKNSEVYAVHMIQNGLTLPDRDYYLKHDKKSLKAQLAEIDFIETIFAEAGIGGGTDAAEAILAIESELAQASWPRERIRKATERYNKLEFDDLPELMESVDFAKWFAELGVDKPKYVIVNTPSFFETLETMLDSISIEHWKWYLKFKLINAYEPYLSDAYVDAGFKLFKEELAGVEAQKPRWERGVQLVAGRGGFGALGDAVGKLYVERYFKPEAKEKMDALVKNLLRAFGDSIGDLTWMGEETKAKAREKLAKIRTKIGYTTKWRSYEDLKVDGTDLVGNVIRSNAVEFRRNAKKLGQPIDREEWGMTPQTVNAYYSPTKNEIVFPAAILQPPFFDVDAPTPLNYGGIGAVIGHEISHAFDDQGSQYDGDGNLNNWWTEEDSETFAALTKKLISQYSVYQPLPGKNVNGKFTLGENIADLSGLTIAFKALAYEELDPEMKVAQWSPQQLFFVGWSRVWQRKYREAEMVKRLLTDPHSPSQYRANGPVMNIDAFYEVFDVKEGDALYKPEADRIKIW